MENVKIKMQNDKSKLKNVRRGCAFILHFTLSFFILIFTFSICHASTISSSPSPNTLNNGLVGYWTLDGKNTNWATGITLDKSGNGNNGQLVNMSTSTSPVPGKVGQGLRFDGVGSYVQSNRAINTASYSISAWIYPTRYGSDNYLNGIVYQGTTSGDPGTRLTVGTCPSCTVTNGKTKTLIFGNEGDSFTNYMSANDNSIALNKWQFVTVTTNGNGGQSMYINGTLVVSRSGASATVPTNNSTYIGFWNAKTDAARFFNGSLDDIRIYNRALSVSEIQQLYNMGAATKLATSPKIATSTCSSTSGLSCGLVGYWTLDGKDTNWSTGITLDKSGNGNNGQLVNMSTSSSPVAGKVGQGLYFNGVGKLISSTVTTGLSSSFTISIWANLRVASPSGRYIINSHVNSYNNYWAAINVGTIANKWTINLFDGTNNPYTSSVSNINFGKWQMVTMVRNVVADKIQIYIDGRYEGQTDDTTTSVPSYSTFVIGNQDIYSSSFPGSLDDIRIYNRALSATEIQQLYNMGAATKLATSPKVNPSNCSGTSGLSCGLVGYWTLDGKDTNWATGITLDKSGNGNNGQLVNMSTSSSPVPGKVGQGFRFDGVGSYASSTGNITSGNFTYSAWFNSKDFSAIHDIVNQGNSLGVYIGVRTNVSAKLVAYVDASTAITSVTTLIPNKWYLATLVYNSSASPKTVLYLNSVSEQTQNNSANYVSTGVRIGRSPSLGTDKNYFSGSLDDIRIYNRALSATEVQQLYQLGR